METFCIVYLLHTTYGIRIHLLEAHIPLRSGMDPCYLINSMFQCKFGREGFYYSRLGMVTGEQDKAQRLPGLRVVEDSGISSPPIRSE